MLNNRNRIFTFYVSFIVFLFSGSSWAKEIKHEYRSGPIKIATQNLYVGADLLRILSATSADEIPLLVAETLEIINATNFPERASAIAEQIKRSKPDLIGLQEVSLIRIQDPGDFFLGNTPAEEVLYDYLNILLEKLAETGLHYKIAALVQNADVELPAFKGVDGQGFPEFIDVRLTDHDVILARKNIKTKNSIEQNFQINLEIPIAGTTLEFTRGYTAVDVKVRGNWYRVANTHIELPGEGDISLIRTMQTQELIKFLSYSNLPIALVGDFNSTPDETIDPVTGAMPPYMQLALANYSDVWLSRKGPPKMGYTCCQNETLTNLTSLLNMRIDHIFVRDVNEHYTHYHKLHVKADTFGDEQEDKTFSGLWPSDHTGVFANIKFLRTHDD